jgi:Secretion system C-terminal sorting domain
MHKFFWLTLTMGFICFASVAQQPNDSSINQQTQVSVGSSMFLNFSYSIKDFNKVMLQWVISSSASNDYFVVEHGRDTSLFEAVGILKRTGAMDHYDLLDNNPSNGTNCYRIKCTDSAGLVFYSNILQFRLSGTEGFKFYPNPVDKLLIVQIGSVASLQILNSAGTVLLSKQLQSGVQVINVSSLEKGEYLLRVVDKENNRFVLEHLLKN